MVLGERDSGVRARAQGRRPIVLVLSHVGEREGKP